jgi:energy-coupling factor transport system ATP-binding protein
MILLEARQVSVAPPGAPDPAVRGVALQVARGEWVALTGPNGGGKSTLLLGLSGLWPAQGEVRLKGQEVRPDGRLLSRGVAVILQDPSSQVLQPTVFDEIAFALRNAGLAGPEVEARVQEVARDLGLLEELGREPARLSAGRQQLVLLAAALAGKAELLLADEPTAHLDPESRCRVLDRVAARVRAGLGVLWATQLEDELERAHRVVEIGDPPEPPGGSEGTAVAGAAGNAGPSGHPGPGASAEPVLRLHVAALEGADGPRVATRERLEIPVARRGVTAIAGPNGAGKSVLLWAAAGLGAPPQVVAEWLAPAVPPPIAALQFPELQIFEELVADELAFAAVSRGLVREAALQGAGLLLRDLGLDDRALLARRTWSLAAGEKRLLEVVAALAVPSSLYVLDEPTAGLDPARRRALARLVSRIAARRPVLVASQDRPWVAAVGARVFELTSAQSVKGP